MRKKTEERNVKYFSYYSQKNQQITLDQRVTAAAREPDKS